MTIGVCTLGYRSLEDFPTDRIPRSWLRGRRRSLVLFYHLAWWPWYMRAELRDFASHVRSHLGRPWPSRSGPESPDLRAEDTAQRNKGQS
ncbi:hypothetical protein PUN4_550105 [Paraburkholderia unamae]|nr:hypothetical protein PUN4_550105 [Paraburkholderia unamae]